MRNKAWVVRFAPALMIILLCAHAGPASGSSSIPDKSDAWDRQATGRVVDKQINEISGIVVGRRNPDVLWAHNDSGGQPVIYALSFEGKLLARYRLPIERLIDWEDIAASGASEGGPATLYIGDIGDNQEKRRSINVFAVPEPNVGAGPGSSALPIEKCDRLILKYPDRPHDAETLLVDPLTRDIYILTKRSLRPRLYRAPDAKAFDRPQVLEYVGTVPFAIPTGGDIAPDGRSVLIRGYGVAGLWKRPSDESLARALSARPSLQVEVSQEPLGEAIAFDATGKTFYTISEGVEQPVYRYRFCP